MLPGGDRMDIEIQEVGIMKLYRLKPDDQYFELEKSPHILDNFRGKELYFNLKTVKSFKEFIATIDEKLLSDIKLDNETYFKFMYAFDEFFARALLFWKSLGISRITLTNCKNIKFEQFEPID